MRPLLPSPLLCLTLALLPCSAATAATTLPADHATGINPDTHLTLTFPAPPTLGTSGSIRILDAATRQPVDTLDLSLPAGPDPQHRVPLPPDAIDPHPPTPTTTTPAVRTTPADLRSFQRNIIGGLPDIHFYPVILHGSTATIYPHNNVLRYGHTYLVQIDPAVFPGSPIPTSWTFRTKATPPPSTSTRLTVAADGSGDFNTVQGALDFVPANPPQRITIFLKNGNYEEIVFLQNKSNLTLLGETRDQVVVHYGNNSAFNPPMPGPARRPAFSIYGSTGIELRNFSITNDDFGQAEALLVFGSKNIVSHMTLKGSGDALNLRGSVYLTDTAITGDGDTILGVGPAFFNHCEIRSFGPFMWIRNPQANHGNVFLHCTFIATSRLLPRTPSTASATTPTPKAPPVSAVLARLPNNHGLNYPYAEAVLLHCRLEGIPPIGWGPIEADPAHLHLWEFDSRGPDGQPLDTSRRLPISRQLTEPQDAKTIADYSNPAFVLDGWNPLTQP